MKIDWNIIIDKSEGQFTRILQFAWHNPFRDSLKRSLEHLEKMVLNRGNNIVLELYPGEKYACVKFAFINTLNGNKGTSGILEYTEIGWNIQAIN